MKAKHTENKDFVWGGFHETDELQIAEGWKLLPLFSVHNTKAFDVLITWTVYVLLR